MPQKKEETPQQKSFKSFLKKRKCLKKKEMEMPQKKEETPQQNQIF